MPRGLLSFGTKRCIDLVVDKAFSFSEFDLPFQGKEAGSICWR